jgi:glycosyltransferase involved in cell wall biosynthesis
MSKEIASMVKKDHYDFVIAEYSVMGQFIHKNSLLPPVRRIISVHECYYLARLKSYQHHRWGIEKIREAINLKGLKKYEFEMYSNADKILTLTPEGKEELLAICPGLDISIVPHGVDVDYFSFSPLEESEKSIVFIGNYLHYPNVDAVLYFHSEIWPAIKSILPDIKFYIVGQSPPPEVETLSQEGNITITGRVADVRPYLRKSGVFICPVRLGGGFRGKILEAMAMGRPVVSTSLGAQGIPASHGENILIADKPDEFARLVVDLMENQPLMEKVSTNARRLMEERYAWEKGVKVLEGILEKMMDNPPRA